MPDVEVKIRDVWSHNLDVEFERIRHYIDDYPFVAMDTEFPGVVATPLGQFKSKEDFNYQQVSCNVNMLKLIQVGFALMNKNGELPPDGEVWQFNFHFSLTSDMYSQESVDLLRNAGIDFERHQTEGIRMAEFGEYLTTSGLVVDDKVTWITFHSGYDFGYLIRSIMLSDLPNDEDRFFKVHRCLFPSSYDIKMITKMPGVLKTQFHGGLQEIADQVQVKRNGIQHQAGSDSLLTAQTFFKLVEGYCNDNWETIAPRVNGLLYGLGNSLSYLSHGTIYPPYPRMTTPSPHTSTTSPHPKALNLQMPFISRKLHCVNRVVSAYALKNSYKRAQTHVSQYRPSPPTRVDPRGVFANNELNLHKIGVYGFDYDYTLAVYTTELNPLIYNLAIKRLVQRLKYPEGLDRIPYDPTFAIRGLHYDIDHCCLLKVDAFNQIQQGTVYRGRKKLTNQEVFDLYGGFSLPDTKGRNLPQLIDLFSLPWAGLLATVVQYFDEKNISFDPVCLFHDIEEAVRQVHISGDMYASVTANMKKYVHQNAGLKEYLNRLHDHGKELFMVTNSPFSFMNTGMCYMLGEDWRRLFKYVVVSAKKPDFFQGKAPFRLYQEPEDSLWYQKVTDLQPGKIYAGGNITDFSKKAKFDNKGVLYFGDHIYTDLADPMLQLGWHTAAIVPELAREIRAQNHEDFRIAITWLEVLTKLIEVYQSYEPADDDAAAEFKRWILERRALRQKAKAMFNPQFGSMFRTYHNMTFFSRRLGRLSDIYTSRLPNMLKYSDEHTFFPRRNALPHEALIQLQHVQAPHECEEDLDHGCEELRS